MASGTKARNLMALVNRQRDTWVEVLFLAALFLLTLAVGQGEVTNLYADF